MISRIYRGKLQVLVFTYYVTRNGKKIRRKNGRPYAFWKNVD